jgi:hypothetical protein
MDRLVGFGDYSLSHSNCQLIGWNVHMFSPTGKCEQMFVRLGSALSRALDRDSCFVDTSTAECLLVYLKVFS